jgi:DNA-binding GntR family transcriptional regulator
VARQISVVPPEAYRLLHSRLLAALEARDAAAAAELMRAHHRELDLNFADVIFGQTPPADDLSSPPPPGG